MDVNSLNAKWLATTDAVPAKLAAFTQFGDNHGPLIRLNKLDNNATNGLEVRPFELVTESVWDDTDIVHVVSGQILERNFHTSGGLRLQSSNSETLVVKFSGATSGFVINGRVLDIEDRIGGSLHVLGTIGHPVVLTSLNDDSVGAGLRPNGLPQLDTNNNGTNYDPGGRAIGRASNCSNGATIATWPC